MLYSLIRKFFRNYRYRAWVLEGTEKHSNSEIRVLYLGGYEVNKNYIGNLIYKPSVREVYLGRFWSFRPSSFSHKRSSKIDIVIIDSKKPVMGDNPNNRFFIPSWIDGKVKIDGALHLSETSENIKCDLRRVRKSQYAYQVVHEREKFIDFYNHMYVPHTTKNYGNEATLHSLEGILKKFEWSELLLIKDGEKPIAGEVIVYQSSGPKLLCLGVLNGDRRYVNSGAIAALFYFRLIYFKKKGYTEIDLGASRGFWNDGVIKYKKKWGMNLTALRGGGFMIHPLNLESGTKSFLKNNPFIVSQPDGFDSVCFFEEKKTLTEKEQKKIINTYTAPGIKKLVVFQLDADAPTMTFSENLTVPVEVRRMRTPRVNGH